MNIKMGMNQQVSVTEFKNKLNKLTEQKQNHKYGDPLEGYQLEEWGKICRD